MLRVQTPPGKMRIHLENLEKSRNSKNLINIMEKLYETWKKWVATKISFKISAQSAQKDERKIF